MNYHPPRTVGLLVGGGLTAWALLIGLLLLAIGVRSDLGLGGFFAFAGAAVAGGLVLLFGFWTYSLSTLTYSLDRNALIITCGPTQQIVPLGAIERLVPGTAVGVPKVRGVTWWGCQIGQATIERIGPVLFYSTHQAPEDVLYVMTPDLTYAVSVEDPPEFARQIVRRQELGPTAELEHHVRRSGISLMSLWEDRYALGLAAIAIGASALVWLQVAVRYNSLPDRIPLHFPASETPSVIDVVARSNIFELPETATALLLVGLVVGALVHQRERMAGYLVFAGAAVVQGIFFIATAMAIN